MILKAILDFEADVASIVLAEGQQARTEPVNTSLLVDYDADGRMLWIEVLSIAALARDDVQRAIISLVEAAREQDGGRAEGPQE